VGIPFLLGPGLVRTRRVRWAGGPSAAPVPTLGHERNEQTTTRRGDDLRLRYQPRFSLRSGYLAGVEALARWEHPAQGQLTAV